MILIQPVRNGSGRLLLMTAAFLQNSSERFAAEDLFRSAADTVHNIYLANVQNMVYGKVQKNIFIIFFCTEHEF